MKVTDVETIVFKAGRTKDYGTRWGYGVPPQLWAKVPGPERDAHVALTRIATDDGVEGYCLGAVSERVKALLVGEDPLDRERLWQWMYAHKGLSEGETGIADMALWDLAGRLTKLPVHKLMGAYRDRVKAYASTYPNMGPPELYADHAEACKKQGYKAYKVHAYIYFDPAKNKPAPDTPSFPKQDVAVCRAVRERVGEEMVLMLDPWGVYDSEQALYVGRELEKLSFHFLEHPMLEARIDSYVRLCMELKIAICSPELPGGNLYTRAEWILRGASDISRTDVGHGGLTPCKKTVDLCEAFGVKCEIHGGGWGNIQIHGATSPRTVEYFERGLLHPDLNYEAPPPYLKEICDPMDHEGNVLVPERPGLGMDINWDYVEANRVDRRPTGTS